MEVSMEVPLVDLQAQYRSLKQEIDEAISRVMADCSFVGGKHLESFEQNFARYTGTRHANGVGNGTDALFIALKSLGLAPGDEVITVANSFMATSEAVTLAGAKPVFVDCDEKAYNIDVGKVAQAITSRTKVLLPVHLYGQPADMAGIMALAQKHGLFVIEDAAQAHGAKYNGQKVGTFGDLACFSFFPGKNLGAYGDGGAIVSNNDQLALKARMFANHGRIGKYDHEFEGANSRLDGLQAAILDVKLKYLDQWNSRRRAVAKIYDEQLQGKVGIPYIQEGCESVYHLYVIRLKNRDKIAAVLKSKGISTGIHYPIPLPLLKAYDYLGHKPQDFPVANALKDQILSLPIHGSIRDEEVYYVIEQLKSALEAVNER